MTNPIGIVQGRLSPPLPGRLQAFPWRTWREEFSRARTCGFASIEWVFEADRHDQNPIWTHEGVVAIRRQVDETGVRVDSICADYFMAHPLFGISDRERQETIAVLEQLIRRGAGAGVKTVLLPVLEASEIRSGKDKLELLDCLRRPLELAAAHRMRIGLETELGAEEYRKLVEAASHPALVVYYDVGNATAKGFDVASDIRVLGPHLGGVHIKDRRRGGPSVPLGRGDVNFGGFFDALAEAGYEGPLVLQPATSADFLGAAAENVSFVRNLLQAASPRAR
jgi:L-ribulose-5-phosphate 3-epimerase